MPSLYHHPELYDRLRDSGVPDRFVRGIKNTYEQVISIAPMTSPEGLTVHVLSIDLVAENRQSVCTSPLAMYPWHASQLAISDGELVARKFNLALRRATARTGWDVVFDPDGPKPVVVESSTELHV